MPTGLRAIMNVPLFRLLAINLASGIAVALLMIGGLLVLNPFGLRGLILADHSSGAPIALLVIGFIVTFGSTAMGTAIMALGRDNSESGGTRAPVATNESVPVKISAR